jgi:hypothetical protein
MIVVNHLFILNMVSNMVSWLAITQNILSILNIILSLLLMLLEPGAVVSPTDFVFLTPECGNVFLEHTIA